MPYIYSCGHILWRSSSSQSCKHDAWPTNFKTSATSPKPSLLLAKMEPMSLCWAKSAIRHMWRSTCMSSLRTSKIRRLSKLSSSNAVSIKCTPSALYLEGIIKSSSIQPSSSILTDFFRNNSTNSTCLTSTFRGRSPIRSLRHSPKAARHVYLIRNTARWALPYAMTWDSPSLVCWWGKKEPLSCSILEASTKLQAPYIGSYFWGQGHLITSAMQWESVWHNSRKTPLFIKLGPIQPSWTLSERSLSPWMKTPLSRITTLILIMPMKFVSKSQFRNRKGTTFTN